jgi:signal transduction histidine kinase
LDTNEQQQADSTPRAVPDSPEGASDLTFPDIARLELDELLTQLMARAQDVLNTQGRLRGLLKANHAIAADLSLPVLLRTIAETARDLIGARYAALGVLGPGQDLSEFIPIGSETTLLQTIGRFPHGEGILGLLIEDPKPIRLTELSDHPKSVGFPPGHPPMHSFLGVPIRVRDRVFGNLYLTEKLTADAFTSEDEELLIALASAAGVAIENAQLFELAQRKQRWLEASAEIARRLLAGEEDPLPVIAARARQVADADLAAVLTHVPGVSAGLLIAAADGAGATELRGRFVPREGTLAGQALQEGDDLVVQDALGAGASSEFADVPLGPAMIVRLQGAGSDQPGVLAIVRKQGREQFDPDEQEMTSSFANHASLALELSRAQQTERRLLLVEERGRIARDLHDEVIQRLFATGLSLSGLITQVTDPKAQERLNRATEDLDDTIRAIRQTIFQLHHQEEQSGTRTRILNVLTEAESPLGFPPEVRLEGPIDTVVPGPVADDLVAVLREALSNVARHARASQASVTVAATAECTTLSVADNGVGLGDVTRSSGLTNMRVRAEGSGGKLSITSPLDSGAGTKVTWTVPNGLDQ